MKRAAFLDDTDRRFFLWILEEFNSRFDVEVEAFCLMTTHYHLILACPLDNLAAAMHRLGFLYTQYFNERHEVDGPLFSDRFYSNPIHDDTYRRNAVRYVHRNPLAIDPDMDLARYRWSSHAAYLGKRRLDFVVSKPTLELFGGSRAVFQDFVEDPSNDISPLDLESVQDVVNVVTGRMPQATLAQQELLLRYRMQLVCLVSSDHLGRTSGRIARDLPLTASGVRGHVSRARARIREDQVFAAFCAEVVDKVGPNADLPTWWEQSWGI